AIERIAALAARLPGSREPRDSSRRTMPSRSDRSKPRRLRAWGLLATTLLSTGCGHELVSRSADVTRKVSPIPACVHPLDPRGTPRPGLMRTLTPKEYWQAAFAIEPEAQVQ